MNSFDTGRYLVFGCLHSSSSQVHVPTRILTSDHSILPFSSHGLVLSPLTLKRWTPLLILPFNEFWRACSAFWWLGRCQKSPHDEKLSQNPLYLANLSIQRSCAPLCQFVGVADSFLDISWLFWATMYLQLSVSSIKYINFLHYSYLAYISMLLSLFVFVRLDLSGLASKQKVASIFLLCILLFVGLFSYSDTGF